MEGEQRKGLAHQIILSHIARQKRYEFSSPHMHDEAILAMAMR